MLDTSSLEICACAKFLVTNPAPIMSDFANYKNKLREKKRAFSCCCKNVIETKTVTYHEQVHLHHNEQALQLLFPVSSLHHQLP